jgi:predicted lipoprotein with Yx(FWY)xxD motif
MPRSPQQGAVPNRGRRPRRAAALVVAALAGLALAALTGLAVAKSFTLGVTKNVRVAGKAKAVVVNAHGLTVYDLIPETKSHPLCTGACLGFWPPVKVASAHAKLTKMSRVKGKLGIWHRAGFFQVTLGGHPLYTFQGDGGKKGVAHGEGVVFAPGDVWHAVLAASSKHAARQTTTTTTSSSTTTSTSSTSTNPYPTGY